jgi:two-component system sensor kinase FixL
MLKTISPMDSNIFKTLGDTLVVVNKEAVIVDVSPSVTDLFLYEPKELIGQPLSILLPQRFRKNHAKLFSAYGQNPISRRMGRGTEKQFVGVDKTGEEFFIDIGLSSYRNDTGELFYVALIRDISDLIQVQNRLEDSIDELITKNKELDHFAYIVSHDLKAPVRNMKTLLEMIEEDHASELSEEVLEYFQLMKQRNHRMAELINGILNYSRVGNKPYLDSEVQLNQLIEEVIDSLPIPEGITVTQKGTDVQLSTSRTQLSQVLSNLIGNAAKYHDKPTGKIQIICRETIDELEISVKDDGPGIASRFHSKIFDMFGTAHGTQRSDSTGIGLAIVKKIIHQNGGKIEVRSRLGEGAEFIFTWKKHE